MNIYQSVLRTREEANEGETYEGDGGVSVTIVSTQVSIVVCKKGWSSFVCKSTK